MISKPNELMPLLLQYYPLTVSDSGLRVSDIAVIHLRKVRRRPESPLPSDRCSRLTTLDLRKHGIVVYICRCNRQIAVALLS